MAREIDRGLGRVPYDVSQFTEESFQSRPDPRFGGNIARANVGAQYPRGGVDVRYENYRAPHRVDYTRNVPRQTGTPNFRPPYGAPGQPSYPEWMQQIDPFHTGPYPPKQHPNPRMRGMDGGLGGLEEQAAIPNWYKWYDKLINRFGKERGSELWHQYASDDTGIGNNEYQMAEFGGYGYSPNPYDDDEYGPFIPPSVIDMDLEGIGYDPADDEYDFDRKRGFPGRKFGRGYKGPKYAASGGLMSLRR